MWLRKIGICVFAILIGFASWNLFRIENAKRAIKQDQIEVHHIKYGLFNVDEWKKIIADIVTKNVNTFEVTPQNRKEILAKTEKMLYTLIDEVAAVMRDKNKKTLGGFFKQLATDILVDIDEIKRNVPAYAETIVKELNDPKTTKGIRDFVIEKVQEYADDTIGEMDYSKRDAILKHYGVETIANLEVEMSHRESQLNEEKRIFIYLLLAVGLAIIILPFCFKGLSIFELLCLHVTALFFLVCGIIMPMIAIEATINTFSFQLMGERVLFENQVIFYQSKSIFEVVELLILNGELPLMCVAILVFSFSVFLPALKLTLSALSLFFPKLQEFRLTKWLIFRSAKWSMADVLVVALFMSYLGFSGVIQGQLGQLERVSGNLEVFTTDNSSLQLGFYLFTSFVLFGLCLSELMVGRNVAQTDKYS